MRPAQATDKAALEATFTRVANGWHSVARWHDTKADPIGVRIYQPFNLTGVVDAAAQALAEIALMLKEQPICRL